MGLCCSATAAVGVARASKREDAVLKREGRTTAQSERLHNNWTTWLEHALRDTERYSTLRPHCIKVGLVHVRWLGGWPDSTGTGACKLT